MHSFTSGKSRTRLLAIAAVTTATAIALAGCSSSDDSSSDATDDLTVAVNVAPTSLDPALQNVDPTNNWFIQLAYDPLIRLTAEGTYEPDLAESWEYLDDTSTQFQLTLRDGVLFNDGTEMTADDVVASLEYMISSGVNGPTWLGADTTVEATDESTVLITTTEPNSQLPYMLSQRTHLGSVISPAGLEDPSALLNGSYGAGPYMLDADATIADSTYVYVQNPDYWDTSKQHWDTVTLNISGSSSASLQAVQNGEADVMRGDIATAQAGDLAGDVNVDTVSLGMFGVGYLDREGEITPELADPLVRQALSYAIDREAITEAVWGEYGVAGNDLTLPGFPGFDEETSDSYAYDPEKAKELLTEAGYPDGFSFDMQTTNAGGADVPAQAVVENWAAIGVTANLTVYSDNAQLIADTLGKKYSVGVYYYGGQPQILQSLSFFTGAAGQYNPFQSTDDEIFADLAAGNAAADPDEADAAYASALERAVVDLAWFSGVAYTPSVMIYGDGLTGLDFGPLTGSFDIAWELAPADG